MSNIKLDKMKRKTIYLVMLMTVTMALTTNCKKEEVVPDTPAVTQLITLDELTSGTGTWKCEVINYNGVDYAWNAPNLPVFAFVRNFVFRTCSVSGYNLEIDLIDGATNNIISTNTMALYVGNSFGSGTNTFTITDKLSSNKIKLKWTTTDNTNITIWTLTKQ